MREQVMGIRPERIFQLIKHYTFLSPPGRGMG